MTDLVLVRHAETIWHAENRYTGISDVALTDPGREQARTLGQWAAGAGLSAIWSSPLSRCRATVDPAAAVTGLAPQIDPRLRELDFGSLEGKTKDEARAAFPEEMDALLRDPVANHIKDGEPPVDAAARAIAGLWDIAAAHSGSRVLVVAHSTLIRLALCGLLGLDLALYRTLFPVLSNCGLTELRLCGQQVGMLTYNVPMPPPGISYETATR